MDGRGSKTDWKARAESAESREAALRAENERLEASLKRISCPTQTENLLWWQLEAREALRRARSELEAGHE